MTKVPTYTAGDLVEVRVLENGTPGKFVAVVLPERDNMPGELVVQVVQARGSGPIVAPYRHPGLIGVVRASW